MVENIKSLLVKSYNSKYIQVYFDRLGVPYSEELRNDMIDSIMDYCKSKEDKYVEGKSNPEKYFTAIMRREVVLKTNILHNFLHKNDNENVRLFPSWHLWCENTIKRSKREYKLKEILS